MKKTSSKAASSKVQEIESFDNRRFDFRKLKPGLSATEIQNLIVVPGGKFKFPFQAIETLSVTKTVGRGRTNLTFIAPTVVQADATVPRAFFNKAAQARRPAIQMHFETGPYGITSNGTFVMEFRIQTFGQSTFNLVGSGNVLNAGTKVLNGLTSVSLVFQNVAPTDQNFGFLEQTAGGQWDWFSVQLRFPDIVITL